MSVERYGNSAWASTARIMASNNDGTLHNYFLKLSELPPGLSAGFIDMRS